MTTKQCMTCGRAVGGNYEGHENACCVVEEKAVVEEVVEEAPVEEPKEEKTAEKPKKKTTPKKKAAKKA